MAKIFRLNGEARDLDCLSRFFSTGDPVVKKDEDQYYLYLDGWDSAAEPDALAAAEAALTRMNGIALMSYDDHGRVTIAGIANLDPTTGKLQTLLRAQVRIVSRTRAYLTPQIDGKTFGGPRGEAVFALTDTNEPLERALYLFGSVEHDWRGLYMVFDAIVDGHGGIGRLKAAKLVPSGKIGDFTGTANSYKALGKDARHGSIRSGHSKAKMTLGEARGLIRNLLEAWLAKLSPGKP